MPRTTMLEDPEYRAALTHLVQTRPGATKAELHRVMTNQSYDGGLAPADPKYFNKHVDTVRRELGAVVDWTVTDDPEPAAVLAVIAATVEREQHPVRMTTAWAGAIHAVARAAPDCPPFWIGWLAGKALTRRESASQHATAVLFAFCPWRSPAAYQRFIEMVKTVYPGWLPKEGRMEGALLDAVRMEADRSGRKIEELLVHLMEGGE